jgi:ribose transport system substrate-binding protein
LVRAHLRRSRARRVLLGASFDHSGLGALRALEEAGRAQESALVLLGGTVEGRAELRSPGTRLVGDVAFFLERYGQDVIGLALDILRKKPVPPAMFARHAVLTPANVDHYYPNDCLLNPSPTGN